MSLQPSALTTVRHVLTTRNMKDLVEQTIATLAKWNKQNIFMKYILLIKDVQAVLVYWG
jgi:hypothetical protein